MKNNKFFYRYQKAVENGNKNAQYNFGILYYKDKKFRKSFLLRLECSKNWYIEVQNNLATLYHEDKRTEKAFYWYQNIAENGHIVI